MSNMTSRHYRQLGRTGLEVNEISLGTEYLIYEAPENAIAVLREAVARGVNYFDVFWPQPGFRDMLGTAFKGIRDTVYLTAHLGAVMDGDQYGKSRDPQVAEKFFFDYLRRVGTDYVDVLYLHNCDTQKDLDTIMKPGGLLEQARRYQGEGKARFIGFSGHNAEIARKVVESGAIDTLMFPVNLASFAAPGQRELYSACATRGVGLVVMKPFGGGSLLREKSTITVEDFQSGRTQLAGAPMHFEQPAIKITATHCLAYALDQVGVSTIVPGCKNLDELAQAQNFWNTFAEERDYTAILPAFQQFANGECVYCNHCLPCPSHIDIGQTMSLFNQAQQNLTDELRAAYAALAVKASECIQCRDCEERCPFGVKVATHLEEAVALFGV
ncbi:MAG: aldo/keto reductase [Thermoflexales bacterium]|nr:aldo/keto reductase [Thermoflexales bacterium]